ncbi:ogr/Delta-like zinc finger family protein [Wohlfahrtiimonas larvae]
MDRRTPHSFSCPQCGHKAKIVFTKVMTDQTREKSYQCSNILCSSTFVTHETITRFLIKTPAQNGN